MSTFSILIVDDEILTLNNLKKALEQEDYEVHLADSGERALEIIDRYKPDLILLDLMLPGISGIEVLKTVKEMERETIVIMMTAYEILEKAVEAMKLGAYDYLLKPFKINDLKNTIHRALETLSLRIRVLEHLESEKGRYYFGKIVAESKKMSEVVELARRVAGSDKTTVLLQGESGTGKELLAKAIHYHSPRSDKPIVDINCAAIPENLLESELFGFEAGAFTDAKKRKIGLLERGDEGTVFFDEIGDMSLSLQAKLLRVLEEGTFTRLGGNKQIKVNIRVITATNSDLAKATEKGEFRQDLFYRLNVVPITIPPLREETRISFLWPCPSCGNLTGNLNALFEASPRKRPKPCSDILGQGTSASCAMSSNGSCPSMSPRKFSSPICRSRSGTGKKWPNKARSRNWSRRLLFRLWTRLNANTSKRS